MFGRTLRWIYQTSGFKFVYRKSCYLRQRLTGRMQLWQRRIVEKLGERAGRSMPIHLTQKKIYVLPTGFGVVFAALLFVSLAGALNYNNNLALAFGFGFCALAFLSVHVAHRNLHHVELRQLTCEPVHAGQNLQAIAQFGTLDQRLRTCLRAAYPGQAVSDFELDQNQSVNLTFLTSERGWLALPPFRLSTDWPFGFFVVWAHFWPQAQVLIYPKLEQPCPGLPETDAYTQGARAQTGEEEFRSLREYRLGDSQRSIAWRASSKGDALLVRELDTPRSHRIDLRYDELSGLTHEAKLSRLTSWCLLADERRIEYGLALPNTQLPPGRGSEHLHQCLRALALAP